MKKIALILLFLLALPISSAFANDGDPNNYLTLETGETYSIPVFETLKIGDIVKIDYMDYRWYDAYNPRINNVIVDDPSTVRHTLEVPITQEMTSYSDINISLVLGAAPIYLYNVWQNDVLVFDGTSNLYASSLYPKITSLTESHNFNSVYLSWENPTADGFLGTIIKKNGVKIADLPNTRSDYSIESLNSETEYIFEVIAVYNENVYSPSESIVVTTDSEPDTTPPSNVNNLIAKQVEGGIQLDFGLPADDDFSHVRIFRNGMLLKDFHNANYYLDDSVNANVTYTYKVVSVDNNGNISTGVQASGVLISEEITNLKAEADYDRVDLSWVVPASDDFEYVKIYRKKVDSEGLLSTLFTLATFSETVSADEVYLPLFETNGTYFNDLTVAPETEYQYLLTSFIAGEESEGVTIDVTTPQIYVGGSDLEENEETGDYTVTWERPTTGQIKIKVGGNEYAIVNAADRQFVVPAGDMVYTAIGEPDITLVPLDVEGEEIGSPISPGGSGTSGYLSDSGITASNLLLYGVGLLGVVGAIVLLGLAFRVVPKVINTIVVAFKGGKRV